MKTFKPTNPLRALARLIVEELLMTPEIVKAIDAMDAAKAEAVKIIAKIGDLKKMIADLQALVAAGSNVGAEDLAALSAKADDLVKSEADLDAAAA